VSTAEPEHTRSGGNVFADLELRASDELLAKAASAARSAGIAARRRLTQRQTAELLGTTQPRVSELFAGGLSGCSMERLMRFLNAFGRDGCIVVSRKPHGREHATLRVAHDGDESVRTDTRRE